MLLWLIVVTRATHLLLNVVQPFDLDSSGNSFHFSNDHMYIIIIVYYTLPVTTCAPQDSTKHGLNREEKLINALELEPLLFFAIRPLN